MVKIPEGLKETRRKIPGYQDVPVGISIFEPEEEREPLPALVYFHGGALPCSQPLSQKAVLQLCIEYAMQSRFRGLSAAA